MQVEPGASGEDRCGEGGGAGAEAEDAAEDVAAAPGDREVQRHLEVQADVRAEEQMEQEERRHDPRVRVGEERHPAALVGVPERQLMKVCDGVEGRPVELAEEIPVAAEPRLGEMAEDGVAEGESERHGNEPDKHWFACGLRVIHRRTRSVTQDSAGCKERAWRGGAWKPCNLRRLFALGVARAGCGRRRGRTPGVPISAGATAPRHRPRRQPPARPRRSR